MRSKPLLEKTLRQPIRYLRRNLSFSHGYSKKLLSTKKRRSLFITRSSSPARSIASGFMMGVTALYFSTSNTSTLSPGSWNRSLNGAGAYIAQLARSGFQSRAIWWVSSGVWAVSFSRPTMNCAAASVPRQDQNSSDQTIASASTTDSAMP